MLDKWEIGQPSEVFSRKHGEDKDSTNSVTEERDKPFIFC